MSKPLNKYSQAVSQDPTQPAAQAMLHAIGLTKEYFKKPFVGIASTGYEGNPCNMHLNDLSVDIKKGMLDADLVGAHFQYYWRKRRHFDGYYRNAFFTSVSRCDCRFN